MEFYEGDWFSHNIPTWEKHLGHLRRQPQLRFLEVGSWVGRSACWLLQNILTHETATLTCIDIFERDKSLEKKAADCGLIPHIPDDLDLEKAFNSNIASIGARGKTCKLKGRSQELLRTLPLHSYDCIYIDGSHLAMDVLTDAVLCWDLLRNGGILIFDDYLLEMFKDPNQNPRPAIDAFLSIFGEQGDLLHRAWQVILRKKIRLRCIEFIHGPLQDPGRRERERVAARL